MAVHLGAEPGKGGADMEVEVRVWRGGGGWTLDWGAELELRGGWRGTCGGGGGLCAEPRPGG